MKSKHYLNVLTKRLRLRVRLIMKIICFSFYLPVHPWPSLASVQTFPPLLHPHPNTQVILEDGRRPNKQSFGLHQAAGTLQKVEET